MTDHLADEHTMRRVMRYEIDPWVPDTQELIRLGRRHTRLRRGATATLVTALAGTAAGVALAAGGPITQPPPPVGDSPSSFPPPGKHQPSSPATYPPPGPDQSTMDPAGK